MALPDVPEGGFARVAAAFGGRNGKQGRRSAMAFASALVGAVLVAAVVLQDGRGQAALLQARPLSATAERADTQEFYHQEEVRDARAHMTSAMSSQHAVALAVKPPPVGSWTFDHKPAKTIMMASAPQSLQIADPAGMLPSPGNTNSALGHLENVHGAMNQMTDSYKSNSGAKPPPPPSRGAGSWAADHARAVAKKPPVDQSLARAEHQQDVKVVQEAVLEHEGVTALAKAPTAGSWQLDHGRPAAQKAKAQKATPAAAQTALATNIAHNFQSAVALGKQAATAAAVGTWAEDHSGKAKVFLAAAKVGGTERVTAPMADRSATATPKAAVKPVQAALFKVSNAEQLGTWARDHGAVLEHKVLHSPKQQGIAAGFVHSAEEKAVESGLRAHGDKL